MATFIGSLKQIEQTDANGVLTGLNVTGLANGIVGNVTGNFTGNVSAGGSSTQIQYNANGVISGISGVTSNGTKISMSNANVSITGGFNTQVLTTDGAGNLSWGNPAAGSNGSMQYNHAGSLTGSPVVTATYPNDVLAPVTMPQGSLNAGSQANVAGLAFGNGTYIAAGGTVSATDQQLYLSSSTDAVNWNLAFGGASAASFNNVKYVPHTNQFIFGYNVGGGVGGFVYSNAPSYTTFVAIPSSGNFGQDVATDTHGTWVMLGQNTAARTPISQSFISVTHKAANAPINSSDGFLLAFTGQTGNNFLNSIEWHEAGNRFITVGANGFALSGYWDGVIGNWTILTTGTTNELNKVVSAGNSVIAAGASGTLLVSTNTGNTWTQANIGNITDNITGLTYYASNATVIATTATGPKLITSTDFGNSWTVNAAPNIANSVFKSVVVGSTGQLVLGGSVTTAPNTYATSTFSGLNTVTANITGFRITGGSNGQYLRTDGTGILNWTSTITAGGSNNQVQLNSSGILGGSANLTFVDSGTGGTLSTQRNLTISRGVTVVTNADEFISIGGNTYGNATTPATIGFNSANSTYAGLRFSKEGTERWYMGTDASTQTGNFVINAGSAAITQPLRINGGSGVVSAAKGYALYNLTATNVNNAVDTTLTTWTSAISDNTGLTYTAGTWTNNTSRPLQVMVNLQCAWPFNGVGSRVNYFVQTSLPSARIGMNQMAAISSGNQGTVLNTTALIQLGTGETFSCNVWQNSGSVLSCGSAVSGMNANESTRIAITVM
jgi:hypothetical protein